MDSTAPRREINPIARALLAGALLPGSSPLRILRQVPELLQYILSYDRRLIWQKYLLRNRKFGNLKHIDRVLNLVDGKNDPIVLDDVGALKVCETTNFPPYKGISCNMLPIRTDRLSTIPEQFDAYTPLIEECLQKLDAPNGVAYLSIDESVVSEETLVQQHGVVTDGFSANNHHWKIDSSIGTYWSEQELWFDGFSAGTLVVSSVSNSVRMWDAKIWNEKAALASRGCDLNHLRYVLDCTVPSVTPLRNEMYWMTDATPYENLDLPVGTFRQVFKLKIGKISGWWKHIWTRNPRVMADAPIVEDEAPNGRQFVEVDLPQIPISNGSSYAIRWHTFSR